MNNTQKLYLILLRKKINYTTFDYDFRIIIFSWKYIFLNHNLLRDNLRVICLSFLSSPITPKVNTEPNIFWVQNLSRMSFMKDGGQPIEVLTLGQSIVLNKGFCVISVESQQRISIRIDVSNSTEHGKIKGTKTFL